jgi:hypothetical protein
LYRNKTEKPGIRGQVEGWWDVFSKEGCAVEIGVKLRLKVTSAR